MPAPIYRESRVDARRNSFQDFSGIVSIKAMTLKPMSAVDDSGSNFPFSKNMSSWCAGSEVSVNSIGSGFWIPFPFVPSGSDIFAAIGCVVFGARRLEG
jgi:hypothetical protein